MRVLRIFACLAVVSGVSACGGGGGSGGGGSDSDGGGGGGGGGSAQGSLSLSPTTLNFSTGSPAHDVEGKPVQATINTTASGTLYVRIVPTGPAVASVSNIQITGGNSGQAMVTPAAAAALGPGVFTSTITVTACTSGPDCASGIIGTPQTVTVTYTISGVKAASPSLAYRLPLSPITADYTQMLSVAAHPSLTATSNASWLTVTPGAGNSGASQLTLNLVKSAVDAFGSGDHTATVTLGTSAGHTLQVPVTLTVAKPQLDEVTPYIAESNKTGTVTLRGLFLDQLPSNGIDLVTSPSGTPIAPPSVTAISPTELRISHPALPPNSYSIRMRDAQGAVIDRSKARLVVVDPTSYPARTIDWPADGRLRNIQGMVYDAERKALLLVVFHGSESLAQNNLVRFEYTSDWSGATTVPFPYLDRIALSADGRDLITASSPPNGNWESPRISLLSPATFAERTVLQSNGMGKYFHGLAVLSNGDVLLMEDSRSTTGPGDPLSRYSLKRNTLVQTSSPSRGFIDGGIAASGDGQRVVVGGGADNLDYVYEYSASSNTNDLTETPVRGLVRAIRMDTTGETVLIRGQQLGGTEFLRIYGGADWNLRGSLPVASIDYALAPDGSRAYVYGYDSKVHVYDLTASPVGSVFPERATLTPLASPNEFSQSLVRMTISSDGRTLFLAGTTRVVVMPLP